MAPPPLQFWFEFASTYSYPAAMRDRARGARAAGVAVAWRPFLLGPIFGAQGWNDSPFNVYPVEGPLHVARPRAHLRRARACRLRRPIALSAQRPARRARRAARRRRAAGCPAFVRAVYRANFAEDREIADASRHRRDPGARSARPPDAILARAQSAETKDAPARADRRGERARHLRRAELRRRRRALLGQRPPRGRDRMVGGRARLSRGNAQPPFPTTVDCGARRCGSTTYDARPQTR